MNRLLSSLTKKKKLPKLPKDIATPVIITGVEALGRGNDLQKLREFVGEIGQLAQMNPQAVQLLNIGDLIERLATGHGIETENLIFHYEIGKHNNLYQKVKQKSFRPKARTHITKS